MFFVGMIIYAYGMGIYFSAQLGAGPRDSFMLAMTDNNRLEGRQCKTDYGSDRSDYRVDAWRTCFYWNDRIQYCCRNIHRIGPAAMSVVYK